MRKLTESMNISYTNISTWFLERIAWHFLLGCFPVNYWDKETWNEKIPWISMFSRIFRSVCVIQKKILSKKKLEKTEHKYHVRFLPLFLVWLCIVLTWNLNLSHCSIQVQLRSYNEMKINKMKTRVKHTSERWQWKKNSQFLLSFQLWGF